MHAVAQRLRRPTQRPGERARRAGAHAIVPALPRPGSPAALCEGELRAPDRSGLLGIRQLGEPAFAAEALVEPAQEALAARAVEEQVQPARREVGPRGAARVADQIEAEQLPPAQRERLVQARAEQLRQRRIPRSRRLAPRGSRRGACGQRAAAARRNTGGPSPRRRATGARSSGCARAAASIVRRKPSTSKPGPSRKTSCETWLAPFMRRIS